MFNLKPVNIDQEKFVRWQFLGTITVIVIVYHRHFYGPDSSIIDDIDLAVTPLTQDCTVCQPFRSTDLVLAVKYPSY